MLGYLKPYPLELLGKEMLRYKSLYCGLCHTLKERYGELPRLALTYDLTTFVALMLAFEESEDESTMQKCWKVAPRRERLVASSSKPLEYAADLTLLMMDGKLKDDALDGDHFWRRLASRLALGRSIRKAKKIRPELSQTIEKYLGLEREATTQDDLQAIQYFAELMRYLFVKAPWPEGLPEELIPVMGEIGAFLAEWIYLMDAIEDEAEDKEKGAFNPLNHWSKAKVLKRQEELELELDRRLALLPYYKDAELMENLIKWTLPETRRRIAEGRPMWRV